MFVSLCRIIGLLPMKFKLSGLDLEALAEHRLPGGFVEYSVEKPLLSSKKHASLEVSSKTNVSRSHVEIH